MKTLLTISLAAIFAVSLLVITPAVADPNENANERAQVKVPDHAKEIAPGIFYLGKSITSDGKVVEGIMAFHHRQGHSGGPGGGGTEDTTTDDNCYSIFAKGASWKVAEPWIVNPANVNGLGDAFLFDTISDSIEKWESSSGSNIMGAGSLTTDVLEADEVSTDGVNEVYFGSIADPGAIAVTITWGIYSGPPPFRGLVEWDMVFDEVDFSWSDDGAPGTMDFENILTHELGHGMGLGHPNDSCTDETMFRFANTGETNKRSLNGGDIAGINELY